MRNALRALKTRAIPASQSNPVHDHDEVATANYSRATQHRQDAETLTAQLLRFIADRPGLKSAEIATEIVRTGFTGGQNPRKNVLTTLGYMVTKGRVRKDEAGRHYPVGEPRQLNLVAANAMAAGLTDHVWTVEEILGMMDARKPLQSN